MELAISTRRSYKQSNSIFNILQNPLNNPLNNPKSHYVQKSFKQLIMNLKHTNSKEEQLVDREPKARKLQSYLLRPRSSLKPIKSQSRSQLLSTFIYDNKKPTITKVAENKPKKFSADDTNRILNGSMTKHITIRSKSISTPNFTQQLREKNSSRNSTKTYNHMRKSMDINKSDFANATNTSNVTAFASKYRKSFANSFFMGKNGDICQSQLDRTKVTLKAVSNGDKTLFQIDKLRDKLKKIRRLYKLK